MKKRTRKLTVTALMLAVAVVLLYIAALLPSGRLAVSAAAGLGVAACVIEGGIPWGLACWVGASFLGILLAPDKSGAIVFALFFGIYPVMKSLLERLKRRPVEWIGKFAFFNLTLSLCLLAWRLGLLQEALLDKWAVWILYLAGNAAFLVYDIAFSRLIAFYIQRIAAKRNGK